MPSGKINIMRRRYFDIRLTTEIAPRLEPMISAPSHTHRHTLEGGTRSKSTAETSTRDTPNRSSPRSRDLLEVSSLKLKALKGPGSP